MGEEVECRLPPHGVRLHLGVFGLTERMHAEVQGLRGDVREAAAFLRAGGAALVLHHPFHFFRGEIPAQAYLDALLPLVDAVEVRNGTMLPAHNDVGIVSSQPPGGGVSPDGRWGRRAAATRTSSGTSATRGRSSAVRPSGGDAGQAGPPAQAFLGALRAGRSTAAGLQGTPGRFAFEIYGVVFNYWGGLLGLRRSGLTASQRLTGAALLGPVAPVPVDAAHREPGAEAGRAAAGRSFRARTGLNGPICGRAPAREENRTRRPGRASKWKARCYTRIAMTGLGRTSLSLFGTIAVIAAILATATIWLVLTDPVTVANSVNEGDVSPLVRELASAVYEALKGLLKYL